MINVLSLSLKKGMNVLVEDLISYEGIFSSFMSCLSDRPNQICWTPCVTYKIELWGALGLIVSWH